MFKDHKKRTFWILLALSTFSVFGESLAIGCRGSSSFEKDEKKGESAFENKKGKSKIEQIKASMGSCLCGLKVFPKVISGLISLLSCCSKLKPNDGDENNISTTVQTGGTNYGHGNTHLKSVLESRTVFGRAETNITVNNVLGGDQENFPQSGSAKVRKRRARRIGSKRCEIYPEDGVSAVVIPGHTCAFNQLPRTAPFIFIKAAR